VARINRGHLRRLENAASENVLLIRQRDGTVKALDRMHVMGEVYLARLGAALGRPPRSSDVTDALEGATPESRRAVEELCSSPGLDDLKPSASPPQDLSEP
jgi:hypothetical protein